MSGRRKNVAIESFFVVILMMIFAIAVAVLIVQGSSTFQKTLAHRESEENLRIAMSYMNMMVRQNDAKDHIVFPKAPEGISALFAIQHSGDELGLKTFVYFADGVLYECYTDGPLDPLLSTKIVPLKDLKIEFDAKNQIMRCLYTHDLEGEPTQLEQVISLRSR